MIDWTAIIVAILGSSVLNLIVTAVIKSIEHKRNKRDAYSTGLRLLLYGQLKQQAKEAMADGSIAKTEYDAFTESYKTYKALGGDGYMDKIKQQLESLPIILD